MSVSAFLQCLRDLLQCQQDFLFKLTERYFSLWSKVKIRKKPQYRSTFYNSKKHVDNFQNYSQTDEISQIQQKPPWEATKEEQAKRNCNHVTKTTLLFTSILHMHKCKQQGLWRSMSTAYRKAMKSTQQCLLTLHTTSHCPLTKDTNMPNFMNHTA